MLELILLARPRVSSKKSYVKWRHRSSFKIVDYVWWLSRVTRVHVVRFVKLSMENVSAHLLEQASWGKLFDFPSRTISVLPCGRMDSYSWTHWPLSILPTPLTFSIPKLPFLRNTVHTASPKVILGPSHTYCKLICHSLHRYIPASKILLNLSLLVMFWNTGVDVIYIMSKCSFFYGASAGCTNFRIIPVSCSLKYSARKLRSTLFLLIFAFPLYIFLKNMLFFSNAPISFNNIPIFHSAQKLLRG